VSALRVDVAKIKNLLLFSYRIYVQLTLEEKKGEVFVSSTQFRRKTRQI